jgi:hypothetical protein
MAGENDDPLNVPGEQAAQERFRKIREELEAMELPDLPSSEELRRRLPLTDENYSAKRFPEAPQVTIDKRNPTINVGDDKDNMRGLGLGVTIAYTLTGAIIGGGFIGYAVNHAVGFAYGALGGAVLGIAFAALLLMRKS